MSAPDPRRPSGHRRSQHNDATGRAQAELADVLVAGLAEVLVPVAERRERQPVTAGPPELPDLVQALSRLAQETLGLGARAMTDAGAVTAEEWRQLGDLFVAHGQACARMAAIVDARNDRDGR